MALTERLALLIDAKTGGAVRDIRAVQREVGALQTPVTRTDRALTSLGMAGTVSGQALKAGLATAAVAGAFGLAKLGQSAVSATSALNEQMSATDEIFGSASETVVNFAEDASTAIGLSERAALQSANAFAIYFDQLGVGQETAAQLSTSMVSLAQDITSLRDLAPGEAQTRLLSGLSGEMEAARRLGIDLSEARVKAEATAMGFEKVNGQFTQQEKILARLSLIFKQTGNAQGNFALTSGQLANSQRTLGAEVENLSASMGETLIPIVTGATQALTGLVQIGKSASNALGGIGDNILSALGEGALTGLAPIVGPVSQIGRHMGWFGNETADAGDKAKNAKNAFASIASTIPEIADSIRQTVPSLDDMDKALDGVRGTFLGALDAQNAYDDALEGIDDASRSAAQAHQDLADAQEDQRRTIADLNTEVERNERSVTRAARAVSQAQRDLAEANEDLAEAQGEYDKVLQDFSPNSRRAHDALEELEDAERRQEDAQFSAEDAAYSLQDAQRALADTTQELRDELDGVGPAADRVRDAQERVRESSDTLRDAQENLGRAAMTLEQAQDEVRDSFLENEAAVGALIAELDGLIAKYPGLATFFQGLKAEAMALNAEVDKTRTLLEAVNLLGQAFADTGSRVLGWIGDFFTSQANGTPSPPPLSPSTPPPNSIGSTQSPGVLNLGKSGMTLVFNEKVEPMHVARAVKRELTPGG